MRTLAILGVMAAAGCVPIEYDGDAVASFEVVGTLTENSCGELAVPAVALLEFLVELRQEGPVSYWRRPGSPIVPGVSLDDDAHRFAFSQQVPALAAEPATGNPGCALMISEAIEIGLTPTERVAESDEMESEKELDTGTDTEPLEPEAEGEPPERDFDYELTGSNTIDVEATAGFLCDPLLAGWGGEFLLMPCRVEYSITGTETDPF